LTDAHLELHPRRRGDWRESRQGKKDCWNEPRSCHAIFDMVSRLGGDPRKPPDRQGARKSHNVNGGKLVAARIFVLMMCAGVASFGFLARRRARLAGESKAMAAPPCRVL